MTIGNLICQIKEPYLRILKHDVIHNNLGTPSRAARELKCSKIPRFGVAYQTPFPIAHMHLSGFLEPLEYGKQLSNKAEDFAAFFNNP